MATGSKVRDAAGNVGTATDLSPTLVQRVVQSIRYTVSGVKPTDWFGPSQPIAPVAQQAEGRVLDYPVGYNLLQRPRQETEAVISSYELRALSEACNIMRLAIETRKDQIARLAWNVKIRETDNKASKSKKTDPRIATIEAFFKTPDKEHDWATWLRLLIEDLLVIDAPTLIRRKDGKGRPYAFNVMDGALIKRVIDESGLTPAPPNPAYQQILHGLPAVDYTTDDLLYFPRNKRSHRLYGFSPVEQVVMMVNIALRRSIAQLNYFTEGNIPEALISCPQDWRPAQIHEMQEIFDGMLSGNLAARSGAKFIPGGLDVQFTKDALLKDDFDEWLARIICFAFSIPPTAFVKQMNRASSQTQKQSADEEGLAPLQQWVKTLMDRILAEDFDAPDLEFVWFDDTAADPLILAQVNQIYVNTGLKNRNEVRSELGLDPMPDGDEYTVTTGTGVVRLTDALDPPEPPPPQLALPAPDQANNSPPTQNANQQNKAPPKGSNRKKKDLTKADDAPEDDKTDGGSHEERLIVLLAAALRQQGDLIAAKVASTEHTANDVAQELNTADDASFFDLDNLFAPVRSILEANVIESTHDALEQLPAPIVDEGSPSTGSQAAEETAESGTANAEAALPSRSITALVNEDAVEYASNRAAELIGRKVVDGKLVANPDAKWAITDTTRDGIRELVTQAEEKGLSVQQLANAIRESTLFSPARAKRIAQWELGQSANNGNLIAWKRSGVVRKKRSLLGSEHKICDECDANAKAGAIDLDAEFPSGHQCSPFHSGCPCTTVPVI